MSSLSVNFLILMYPQGPWCLSAATPERDKLETRTFTDPARANDFIEAWDGQRNIYFHVNPPRDHHAGKKLKRTQVASLNYLHVDIDPSPGEAADAAFRTRALGLLTKQLPSGVPAPTAIVFSGGGFQAFWKLQEPLALDGSVPEAEAAKLYNVKLEQLLGGDNCHNIDRLMRLPGTWNIPSQIKLKKGRERVQAQLVTFEASHEYPLSTFQKASVGVQSTTGDAGDSPDDVGTYPPLASLDELDKWSVPSRVKTVLSQGKDTDHPKKGDDSRSAWLYDAICQLIRFGVPDAVIYSIATDPGWKISESVLDKGDKADTYVRRQIEKAHGTAKTGEHAPPPAGAPPSGGGGAGSGGSTGVPSGDFQRDKNNIPWPNQHNVRLAIDRLGVHLKYDLFADRMVITGLPGFGPVLQDEGIIRMYLEIDERWKFRVGKELFWMVVENEARKNSYHPVREYLDSLQWDGKPRLETWLIDMAGAVDSVYTRAVSRLILIAGARRVREPGSKFDEMLVLISTVQGKGKSTALSKLCPDKSWFTDDLPMGADSKTIMERLAGKWIVEAAELKGMRNSDVEHLKAFLSRASETARMAWGRIAKESLRQCIMFGTTNALRFLRDTTGNRRFWPIQIKAIDAACIAKNRDQLWAEASHYELMMKGQDIRLPEVDENGVRLWDAAGEIQEEHRLDDPYYDLLQTHLADMEGKILSNDVWIILGVGAERRSTQSQQMGEAMHRLGFERKLRRFDSSKKESCYVRGTSDLRIIVERSLHGQLTVEVEGKPVREGF